jgi:chitin synthase
VVDGGQDLRSPGLGTGRDDTSWRSPSDYAHVEYPSKEKYARILVSSEHFSYLPRFDPVDDEAPMQVKEVQNTVEEVPSSRARRWWVAFTWLCTWWIPSFMLKYVGRMKRPDVQMAWREKVGSPVPCYVHPN